MTDQIRSLMVAAMLGGCAPAERAAGPPTGMAPEQAPESAAADVAAGARAAQARATGDLGLTVASLGTAKEPGMWLKTPLVSAPGPGRLTDPRTGRSVRVDLMPIDADPGAGSRLSLAGFRALGVPPTGLPELRVSALPG